MLSVYSFISAVMFAGPGIDLSQPAIEPNRPLSLTSEKTGFAVGDSYIVPLPEPRRPSTGAVVADEPISALFTALQKFVRTPGTKPSRQFVQLGIRKGGELAFEKTPVGWFVAKDEVESRREIGLHCSGFQLHIDVRRIPTLAEVSLKRLDDHPELEKWGGLILLDFLFQKVDKQEAKVPRTIEFRRSCKGTADFTETRYFPAKIGFAQVRISVRFGSGFQTKEDLLWLLRVHYGKYEGICEQVAIMAAGRPGLVKPE